MNHLLIPLLIISSMCFSAAGKNKALENAAKESFELFKSNRHQDLVDMRFCDESSFWDYTWKSLGAVDSLDTPAMRDGMNALRLEFRDKFLQSLADHYREGMEKHNINWTEIEEYSVKVHRRTITIKEFRYELLIPVISFHHEGEHLMWGFESLVITRSGEVRICAKRVDLGPYKEISK